MAEKRSFLERFPDFAFAVLMVLVVMLIIVPLPAVLLDFFMAMNVMIALVVLLTAFFVPRVIDFSLFPTMLLVFTIFGMGLNVSSTRLILSQGTRFAGQMVRAFSLFVVGSSGDAGLGIGVIIFIILIAVQAFVINKGSTRVSEVAARFTLDAMPTRQMAIQTELTNGTITEEEAAKRKKELDQEIGFFRNMDGAVKYISGSVKLGIFITVINLLAGIVIGMVLRGESFTVAIQTYSRLTVGDGLLSQLPTLLTSVATGVMVTRPSSETSLGKDAIREFTQNDIIYFIAGGTFVVMGFLPGFPWYLLIPMGGLLAAFAMRLRRIRKGNALSVQAAQKTGAPMDSQESTGIAPLDPLSLELGFALIPLVDKEKGAELLDRVKRIRQEAGLDLGLLVPKIRIMDNMRLEPSEYCFKIKGIEAGRSQIRIGQYLCMKTGTVTEEIEGEKTTDPAFGLPAVWIREDDRERAYRAGYAVVDPPTIIATHLTQIIKSHAAEILGRKEVKELIDMTEKTNKVVAEEVIKLGLGTIQKVLQGLLREQVSIRNTVLVFETLSDYGAVTKVPHLLVEKVRQALGRQICLQYADEKKVLHVWTVAPDFLAKVLAGRADTPAGPVAALDPATHRAWIASLSAAIAEKQGGGREPVILCPEETRFLIKSSTEREIPALVVLSIPEIPNDIKIEPLGEIHVT